MKAGAPEGHAAVAEKIGRRGKDRQILPTSSGSSVNDPSIASVRSRPAASTLVRVRDRSNPAAHPDSRRALSQRLCQLQRTRPPAIAASAISAFNLSS
jgi:hypothetical protein